MITFFDFELSILHHHCTLFFFVAAPFYRIQYPMKFYPSHLHRLLNINLSIFFLVHNLLIIYFILFVYLLLYNVFLFVIVLCLLWRLSKFFNTNCRRFGLLENRWISLTFNSTCSSILNWFQQVNVISCRSSLTPFPHQAMYVAMHELLHDLNTFGLHVMYILYAVYAAMYRCT